MTSALPTQGHTALAIPTPLQMRNALPGTAQAHALIAESRCAIRQIIRQQSDRLLVVVGPCSIHDTRAALAYADRLVSVRNELSGELEIVMRAYFEKPRTRTGWKGLLYDPLIDDSGDIEGGIRAARDLLVRLTGMGMPVATEFLSPVAAHYLADLVSWGAIGARTTESQIHRELASGLPCPIGFKNSTDGNVKIATDAIYAASAPHQYLGVTDAGHFARISTLGNPDCHLVLRGGARPNYDAPSLCTSCGALALAGLDQRVIIDASHGNSGKNYENQVPVCDVIAEQISEGEQRIVGVMIESNLLAGRKDYEPGEAVPFGMSITDACLGWTDTVRVLDRLAKATSSRRKTMQQVQTKTIPEGCPPA
ncbi:3-deoxy-7-phosphoheptulonate synthase [Burkholderia ubonensis]|uniref:3-deoxy-7-phosphoheptulonate synthase n=1 Tax=Burkholderia ubonensis TaxID=101571 RepID=UPI0009B42964|nr:3-deoxy-7-phosphoheptulonate synthase [Burkholderia ubonensis]